MLHDQITHNSAHSIVVSHSIILILVILSAILNFSQSVTIYLEVKYQLEYTTRSKIISMEATTK